MKETEQPQSQDTGTGSRRLLPIVAAVLSIAVLVVLWNMWTQMGDLEERLEMSQNQSESLERELEGVRSEADDVRAQAQQAQTRAQSAEEQAQQFSEARKQAELERELAREQAQRSEAVSQQARREAEIARREADEIRKQREDELDRMQQAFSRIVDTRRTPLGMVMNLGEDSFLFDFGQGHVALGKSRNSQPHRRRAARLARLPALRLRPHGRLRTGNLQQDSLRPPCPFRA